MRRTTVVLTMLLCLTANAVAQDSLNVTRVGQWLLNDIVWAVVVQGNYAYLAANGTGMPILDISNPAAPVEVGTFQMSGWAFGVAVSGNYAYVADYLWGLRIVDVADPVAPMEVGSCRTQSAVCVAVSGNYAYVTRSGLRVVNVSNPATPTVIGHVALSAYWGVAVSGNYAYVTADSLRVVDVSDPETPVEIGFFGIYGRSYGVAVSGNHVYVTDYPYGLRILDVTDPAAPVEVGFYHVPGAVGVAVSGNYAFVADADIGFRIVDVSDPAAPVEVGFYHDLLSVRGVAVSGNFVYLTASGYFGIYDVSAAVNVADSRVLLPASFALNAYPNPFNARTQITFEVPRAAEVDVHVFDITGRLVRTLAAGLHAAGTHTVSFDGSELASGMYFVRLHSGEFTAARKLLLLR